MKAGYLKSPFNFEVRDLTLRHITQDEVLVDVKACSVCGYDMILARDGFAEWGPFGHEISGVVNEVGDNVHHIKVGDKVVLESGSFNRYSDDARNGDADLDGNGGNFWRSDMSMGFAEQIITPIEPVVVFDGIPFEDACLVEPMGVAYDLVKTADIKLGNSVLVMGLGPIGIMAAKLAILSGATRVYATELPEATARIELAKKWGVAEVYTPNNIPVKVDRVLVTAPPTVIPSALECCKRGGIVAFLGMGSAGDRDVLINTDLVHFSKLQLRGSHASPAMYFPKCLDLIKCGAVKTGELITNRFKLDGIADGIIKFRDDRQNSIKAVMIND